MKDSLGSIIYVGKSKNLKSRVSSYFLNSRNHPSKIERLVKSLKDFEFILTDTEFEAFMLECRLIKELKPIYNKQMKTPSSYVYIGINTDEWNKSISIVNTPYEKHYDIYLGPYTSKNTVEKAIQGIKEFCKIDCNNSSKRNTPCLNYSLGLCIGMCLCGAAAKEYTKIIFKIIELLNGTDMSVLEEMKQKMKGASENFDFETAAKYRDYISAIKTLLNKERVIEFTEDNKNIAVVEDLGNSAIKLFLIKGNRVLFNDKYNLNNTDIEQLSTAIRNSIIKCFENKVMNSSIEISKDDIDEAQIIYSYLKSNICNYTIVTDEWIDSENNAYIDKAILNLLSFKK